MTSVTEFARANPIRELGLLTTRTCNAACGHCGSNSGPTTRGRMSPVIVEAAITGAADYGIRSLMVSGGEPMIFVRDVYRIAESARAAGLTLTICSNGGFGSHPAQAREWLLGLRERGLERMVLSTDRFHLAFVPLASVITVANIAEEIGMPCQIAVPASAGDWQATTIVTTLQRETNAHVHTHPIHPVGRGEQLAARHFRWRPLQVGPCHLVGHVEVDVDGTVSVCPTSADFPEGSPLILGSLQTDGLAPLLTRFQATPWFQVISRWGPLGLHALINGTTDISGFTSTGRLHDCHLCRSLNHDRTTVMQVAERTGIDLLEPVDDDEFQRIAAWAERTLGEVVARSPDPVIVTGAGSAQETSDAGPPVTAVRAPR